MKDKISGSKAGETSLKESRERISRFLRRVEYEFSKRSPSEEKSIDWLTFGYFISFYSHSFEEQTNYLGNIREFTFFFLFFFFELLLNIEEKVGQVSCLVWSTLRNAVPLRDETRTSIWRFFLRRKVCGNWKEIGGKSWTRGK